MTTSQLFSEEEGKLIQIIDSAENGMCADEMGEAILGMKDCLQGVKKIL